MTASAHFWKLSRLQFRLLSGLFLAALVLRLLYVIPAAQDKERVMAGDGWDYYGLAVNLVEGRGFSLPPPEISGISPFDYTAPTSRRPPLFPLMAAAVMKAASLASGHPVRQCYGVVLFVNALLDAATVLVVFRLAQLAAGIPAGFFAAAGYAINYYVFQHAEHFLSEPLFIFLQALALLWLLKATKEDQPYDVRFWVSGFLWGLATLTRPLVLLFPFLVAGCMQISRSPGARKRKARAGAFLAAFLLTLLPWTVRNRIALGHWVLISTVGGQTFYHSNYWQSHGQWRPQPMKPWERKMSEPERDAYYYRKGLDFILQHPGLALINDILKVLRLYYVFYPGYDIFFGTVFLLAVAGFWRARKKKRISSLFFLLILYTTALCALFWGTPRFRDPLFPCFLVYAGAFLSELFEARSEEEMPRYWRIYAAAVLALNLIVWVFAEPIRSTIKWMLR